MNTDASTRKSGNNVPIFSVSEVSGLVKSTVEDAFGYVRIRGEISGFKRAASGHLYFALKDDAAVIDGVCWRSTAGRLSLDPDDGMEVIATGRITTYAGRSKYQMVVESLELAGEGALLKLLEARKRQLTEEGLFAEETKQDLPFLPGVIGVVTSPTGSVIRDILHRLADRFPRHVLVWPVLVQGEGAAEQIAAAIHGFNALDEDGDIPRPDILIVARGGGSLEDLWAFNEEVVVRAVAASDIPLISAVGHETDWTLIDLASDMRAPTPTAAAEMAVPVRLEVMAQIDDLDARLLRGVRRSLSSAERDLTSAVRGLPNLRRTLEEASQRLDDWSERLKNALGAGLRERRSRLPQRLPRPDRMIVDGRRRLEREAEELQRAATRNLKQRREQLSLQSKLLESYSFERVLDRGFVLVTDSTGDTVASAEQAALGQDVTLRFRDGSRTARIAGNGETKSRKKSKSKSKDDSQGSLL